MQLLPTMLTAVFKSQIKPHPIISALCVSCDKVVITTCASPLHPKFHITPEAACTNYINSYTSYQHKYVPIQRWVHYVI